jgi:hypothetical protein
MRRRALRFGIVTALLVIAAPGSALSALLGDLGASAFPAQDVSYGGLEGDLAVSRSERFKKPRLS